MPKDTHTEDMEAEAGYSRLRAQNFASQAACDRVIDMDHMAQHSGARIAARIARECLARHHHHRERDLGPEAELIDVAIAIMEAPHDLEEHAIKLRGLAETLPAMIDDIEAALAALHREPPFPKHTARDML